MNDLKQLFQEFGAHNVRTYIQSGNVVFDTAEPPDDISIQDAFSVRFGFDSAVVLRSWSELQEIVHGIPFSSEELDLAQQEKPDVEHLYVFLSGKPIDKERVLKMTGAYSGRDRLILTTREAYLLCYESVRNSKLSAVLGKPALSLTSRNMSVIRSLLELMNT